MVKVLLCIRMKIKLSFHMFWHWFALLFISPTFLSIVSYIRIRIFSFPNRCLRILNLLLLCFHVAISSLIEFFTISFFFRFFNEFYVVGVTAGGIYRGKGVVLYHFYFFVFAARHDFNSRHLFLQLGCQNNIEYNMEPVVWFDDIL